MRSKAFRWLDREFVALSAEAAPEGSAGQQAVDLLRRMETELQRAGLSLDDTVLTRTFARDREARGQASTERNKILVGRARSASSSFIAPYVLDSAAQLAFDLVALRPPRAGLAKTIREYDPPTAPVRYIVYDSVVFLSGVASGRPTLAEAVSQALGGIGKSLVMAGTSWDKAAKMSCFLHRGQQLAHLKKLLHRSGRGNISQTEYIIVDGYAREGFILEIEVTATL